MADLIPLLPYDSGAIRALAGDLRRRAAQLHDAGSELTGVGGALVFEGPAGDRVRDELKLCARDAANGATRLQDAAGKLDSAAADVDSENARIDAHNQQVLRDMSPMERRYVLENR